LLWEGKTAAKGRAPDTKFGRIFENLKKLQERAAEVAQPSEIAEKGSVMIAPCGRGSVSN